ncbi:hypothetical protein PAN31117_00782 [Pandoraea anapnoica]|uniref:Uncharacterized protein n=1 Tax=Pandoraea anapnoica TaxID=2508301 RepID=A0A5E4ZMF0_9BURK|nr:hypothetical protein [Pandoraea anapnoica]VVE62176.1 hypothetical protein PAN31117_00782 [Pandoraea anapnoica]
MPHELSLASSHFSRVNALSVNHTTAAPSTEPARHLVDDFARAQQTPLMLTLGHRAPRITAVAQAIHREHGDELSLVLRRTTNLASSRGAQRGRALASGLSIARDAPAAADQIYTMLRDEVAVPALRRFERLHCNDASRSRSGAPASRNGARPHAMTATPPWFDELLPHLRTESQLLAQRGLCVDKVRHRLDALVRHEHPGVSWRAMQIGLERDALPFALGATVLSVLADTVDPQRRLALMWPPIEAAGVVLINLIGMARFTAGHPELASRMARITPTQSLEAVSAMLRHPVRDVAAHVIGFVFCYGVVRNLARIAVEAGLSSAVPGIMAYRFGNTIHAALEILLCPIPGALLGPIIDRIALDPDHARLEPLLQDRFADLICKMSDDVPPEGGESFWPAFQAAFGELLRSGAPKAIWLTLTLGFYFLSTFHSGASAPREIDDAFDASGADETVWENALALRANATTPPDTGSAEGEGVDWHTQAVLSVLYGLIASFVSMQGMASRHEAIATAYTRRRGRPKISTVTLTSQIDSGHSSGSSHSDLLDSPVTPASPTSNRTNAFSAANGQHTDAGDTSGDDAVFLPMNDAISTSSDSDVSSPVSAAPHDPHPGHQSFQARKRGTSIPPAGVLPPVRHQTAAAPDEDGEREDIQTAL